jgi:tetratricopeptide (TPR) repeat protein
MSAKSSEAFVKPAKRRLQGGFLVLLLALCAAAIGWSIPQAVTPVTPKPSTPTAVDPAVAMWNKGDYSAAIAEFQKILQQDPENLKLHSTFVSNASNASSKEARLKIERDRALAAQKTAKPDAPSEKKADGAAAVTRPVLSAEELAKMEADVKAANAALEQLTQLYEGWAKANPKKAVYVYELALLTDRQEFEKREQYLLKAVALDPKLTEAYQQLLNLNNGIDDAAAAKYAKKAADTKPDDFQLKLTYASALWTVDQAGARKYYRDLVARNAGTKNGSTALQRFAGATEDPKEKVALIEQFRREYPKEWSPAHGLNSTLYAQYVAADPAKGLAFAQEILKGLGKRKP